MSDRFFAATRKGLFTVERKGGRWDITGASFLGDNLPIVAIDRRDGSIYAAIHHGHFGSKLHRSSDGGRTWTEIGIPAYPPREPGQWPEVEPMGGKPLPESLQLVWSLEAGGKDQPGRLWCGTIPGGLFRSEDHGANWSLVRPLWDHPGRKRWFGGGADWPGIHSICVDPRDARHVAVGVSCGGVWTTRDDGESWECTAKGMFAEYMPPEGRDDPGIQDPHLIVQCAANPEALWAQHHNGIFRTVDGCRTWTNVACATPSHFGFAVAVHPARPDTAWFVPAIKDEKRIPVEGQVVVTRTRDGGRSFDVLRNGLPQKYAFDLTFRHGLDVDETGERLAFGSTTGSLWVTDNGGDAWQNVSTHLPPVYCVRFVK